MKHEDLVKMSMKDLKARLKALNEQAKTAEGEALDAIMEEAKDISGIMADAQNRAALAGLADSADDPAPEAGEGEGEKMNSSEKAKAFDARGKELKGGKTVSFSASIVVPAKNALSVQQTAPVTHTASDIKPTFGDVSSLVDLVKNVMLSGGETYERAYVKSYGDGAGPTEEGKDYNETEPVFAYVTISKQKITAYTEEPEEMIKLPNADYDGVVEDSVRKAIRRYMSRQILIGDGSTAKFKGIFFNPTEASEQVIDPKTDVELSGIDDGTLDELIYSYGGEEEVEGVATLILNKKDLKAFAKLRDKQGRKVYTIVNRGNTGTIDGVPFVINSACAAVTDEKTAAGAYSMAYGPLENYEMAIFSDIDTRKSEDFKFKSGQICFRASIFAGGAVASYNGFIRAKKKGTAAAGGTTESK